MSSPVGTVDEFSPESFFFFLATLFLPSVTLIVLLTAKEEV